MPRLKLLLITCIVLAKSCLAQDSSRADKFLAFPDKIFSSIDKKTRSIEAKLDKQTNKYLAKMSRQERRLKRKLSKKDSLLANQLFAGADERYKTLKSATGPANRYASVYSGHLDSLTTALHFIQGQSISENQELQKALAHYNEFQQKLNASEQVRRQLLAREKMLKEQFQKLGMVRQLKQYRKQVYYYQAQVRSYKEAFEDPSKLEARLMEVILKVPQFKEFFAKNSMLGSLFAVPSGNSTNTTASLAGLQTRAMVNQTLINRFGSSAAVTQQLQQNVQSAQGQLNALKNKIKNYGSGSYGNTDDGDIPGFKPNTEKTKSFLQRLEYGGDVQSQKARYFFPVTSDIALSLGFRINDKSVIGIAAAYKLGWGNNWNNIRISHQGLGLRSFLDWKIKGSFYVSGGYEQNYRTLINSVNQLSDYSAWQTSGLIGLSKKYYISKKLKGEMKILWDFMSYRQLPRTQAVLFRVGYALK